MPPKKTTSAAATTSTSVKPKRQPQPAVHASYKDMIKDAILNLKERNGSSRQAIKKYVLANNNINASSTNVFDSQFNRSIRAGVDSGDFTQPKGPSGPVKLAKKEPKKETKTATTKKAKEPKKETATKKDTKDKEKEKEKEKPATTKKKTTAAKSDAPKKTTTPRTKATAGRPRKTAAAAPAVTEKDTVLKKTKSGRIAKTTAPPETKKKAAKQTTTKKATPKKKAEAEPAEA